jgi:membrane protein YfhO
MQLPFGSLFREAGRFLWVTSFALALLVGFAVDYLVAEAERGPRWIRMAQVGLVVALVAIGYSRISPSGLTPSEWTLAAIVVLAAMLAMGLPRPRTVAGIVIAIVLAMDLVVWRPIPFRHLLERGFPTLVANRPIFDTVRKVMTPQDRVYLVVPNKDFSLQQKTGALFGVPSIFDYQSQASRRYAAFFTMMRIGRTMTSLNDWMYVVEGFLPGGFRRRLLDLASARFVVADVTLDRTDQLTHPPLNLVMGFPLANVKIYENTTALPRARWVPQVEVVDDPQQLLQRLAYGNDDLRRVALVEEPTPSGRQGSATDPKEGTVTFVRDDPEDVRLSVRATQPGFLVLADQYFPGWFATVNGAGVPIARANFAFRLVEVPAGESTVEFHYAPRSVWIGMLVSAAAGLLVIALFVGSRDPREPSMR